MKISWRFLVFYFSFIPLKCSSLPQVIKLGGLFDATDRPQDGADVSEETAFRYAVDEINYHAVFNDSRLSPHFENIPPSDSFLAAQRVCHLLSLGIATIIGPQSGGASHHIQSICDNFEIPHIETSWNVLDKRTEYSLNLSPNPRTLARAHKSLILSYGWQRITILYQNHDALIRLAELLKLPTEHEIKIVVQQLNFQDKQKNMKMLREVKNSGGGQIVVDCDYDKIRPVLKQAQAVGMMTADYDYLITTLDLHSIDLEDFKYGGTNITAFRIVDPNNPEVINVVRNWVLGEKRFPSRKVSASPFIKTETALVHDAVQVFAAALRSLDSSQEISLQPLSCWGDQTWQHGNSLINYMKLVEIRGLTGWVKFDQFGLRTDFTLDIVELHKSGLEKVGSWHDRFGIQFDRLTSLASSEPKKTIENKTIIVTTIKSPPYALFKESPERLLGNEAFEGFGVELIQGIADFLNFNVTLKWVEDGQYGSKNKETGEWNGMLGEILEHKADLAIADLTINSQRNDAVDFSMPFMRLGISILYKAPEKLPPTLFAFLDPFSGTLWFSIGLSYVLVSITLFVVSRFTPMEWVNDDPCDADAEEITQSLYINHSLWWAWAAVMWMGCEVAPRALSTRFIAGMWYLFTLIMVSSYTANLAASLTAENLHTPIKSAEDLLHQSQIQYGCLGGGSTFNFFKSADETSASYMEMYNYMASNPEVLTSSNKAGIARVKEMKGRYAFFMESSSIEYIMERDCDLAKVGGELDAKSYGIGMRKNYPYKEEINYAILKLQENGFMHKLKTKWWKQKGAKNCKAMREAASSTAKALTVENVAGAFLVLIIGITLATITAIVEFLWDSRSILTNENSDKCGQLKKEALSNFGRRGRKYNLNRSSSSLSSLSDMTAIQSQALRPRRPTLKKSNATLNSFDTLKEGTPAEGGNNKRVMIIIDGNNTELSSSISSSSSSSVSSSEFKDTTEKSDQ